MARPSRSRGPYGDPRLAGPKGDLPGTTALVLVVLMVIGIALVGALLVGVGRLVPTPVPTVPPTAAPVVTPRPSRPPDVASSAPSRTPTPTGSPVAIVDPGAILAAVGDSAPITQAGQEVGTVTLESAVYRARIQGQAAPAGSRWLRISLTFRATESLIYDPGRWSVVDTRSRRHRWNGAAAPDSPLGVGTLEAGQSRTGYLVIAVPATVETRSVILQGADGHDMVIFALR